MDPSVTSRQLAISYRRASLLLPDHQPERSFIYILIVFYSSRLKHNEIKKRFGWKGSTAQGTIQHKNIMQRQKKLLAAVHWQQLIAPHSRYSRYSLLKTVVSAESFCQAWQCKGPADSVCGPYCRPSLVPPETHAGSRTVDWLHALRHCDAKTTRDLQMSCPPPPFFSHRSLLYTTLMFHHFFPHPSLCLTLSRSLTFL